MNKHFIILPVLLTSAVSLHVLSYNLEEPPEIVQNSPIPVTSPLQSGQPEIPVVSASSDTVVVVPSQISKSPNIVVANSPVVTTVPSVTPNTTTSVTTTVTTTPAQPSPSATNNIQITSALIPTKNYGDMVREAKQVGGRVDPFLSMKPPEMEKLPELPTPSPNTSFSMASKNSGNTKSNVLPNAYAHIPSNMKIPNPPRTFIPNDTPPVFESIPNKGNTKSTTKNTDKIASNPVKNNTSNGNKSNSNSIIVLPETLKVERGLQLTGIITGNKPLALIKVDNESKVFGIGDIIRQDGKIKIVSINFENQAVTLSDNKNRKVKLEIKS